MTNPTRWWSNEAGTTLRAAIEARGLTVAEFAARWATRHGPDA